ncbi:2-iminoacetate synthase ThiH [Shewanella sp. Choline-02u-19]|jgi:2-iminoacetate synthase|uniref:2-iminoacetate synthase ThiH n=1 Tax=unclassified Shewanella TaxID=196818 RepID=UPI000C33CC5B|nr:MULTISPECIES: 2-iminoacetate synthase ThiH [unclassified Shewanella]PKG58958.1 2-iminoacetate synthase ThiH [Shewanella sp. GutDb-MelDb]PKH55909.1 2-iminoacetate synthase ThiH [Shewanella sp. Bg11-22]PKI27355.1 2-iminoacetate synthase ThiH [Shewanella sp. Choline-02u-19]
MSFVDEFKKLSRSELQMSLYSTTKQEVERALQSPAGDLNSLLALLSPAAEHYLEEMAQRSAALTRQRFGASLGMYIPLYLSNLCANECDYCGFTMSNKLKRKTLSETELLKEMSLVKQMGYDAILLVSGEHDTKVGLPYFKQMLPLVKQHFSHVAMEVQPLDKSDYESLIEDGLDAVMLYQETYNPVTYAKHHTRGKKKDFSHRLESPERVAQAGVDKIGLGVLLGLDDWRLDALLMGHHLAYLEKHYWRSRYSISLPRLRPCTGGVSPKVELTDAGLVQMICAFRLFNQQLEISLSTRETPALRDNLFALGVTNVSAGSSTQPGGYDEPNSQLDQFEISDDRSPQQVAAAMNARGFNPVWKDWEMGW